MATKARGMRVIYRQTYSHTRTAALSANGRAPAVDIDAEWHRRSIAASIAKRRGLDGNHAEIDHWGGDEPIGVRSRSDFVRIHVVIDGR